MNTTKAKTQSAKKSKSTNDYSTKKNSTKISNGIASPEAHGMQSSQKPMGAFYSSGTVTSISPSIQAKFIQKKEAPDEMEMETEQDTGSVQFMCAECESEAEQNEDNVVQSQSADEDQADEEAEGKGGTDDSVENDMGVVQSQSIDEDQGDEENAGESASDNTVQMWNCDDYPEPTCSIQSKEDASANVQFLCPECEAEAESEDRDAGVVQSQSEDENVIENESAEEGEQASVQMWNCDDYPEPTCSIQSKEEPDSAPLEDDENVQAKCSACENDDTPIQHKAAKKGKHKNSVLKEAANGLRHASQPLPHNDVIQSSFGHHDISSVRTEVGGAAGRASKRMGALAYASGNRIGFRHSPSLHLAAHEAAHTVQQRSGLKLPGNVGRPGDRWERHADHVADAVVAGKSAVPLLNKVSPAPSSKATISTPAKGDGISGAVQHRLTTSATRKVEPPHVSDQGEAGAEEEEAAAETSTGAEAGSENVDAVEETVEANEEEINDPEANCEDALGEEQQEPNPCDVPPPAAGENEQNNEPPEKGRCYEAEADDPPPGSQEPQNDSSSNDIDEESDVGCGDWEESNDECECAAREAMQQQSGGDGQNESILSAQVDEISTTGGGAEGANTESTETAESGGDEAQAADSEAGGSGGGGEQDAVGSESSFVQNEASRDAAIAEYKAATGEVDRIPNRTLRLSKGLRFSGAEPGSAEDEARRAMALNQIRGFMLRANGQIESAVAFVSSDVPARLGAMAESVKAGIDTSMAEQKSVISSRIAQAKSLAISSAAGARAAINADYESGVTTVNDETDTAIQTLNDSYTTSTTDINTRENTSLNEINTRFQNGRVAHDNKGVIYANEAITTGQSWVTSYDKCRKRSSNHNKYNGDDGFMDGCLTVRRAKAQQDAACTAASGTAKNMKKEADKKGYKLREQRTQYRCAVISASGQALSTLDTTIEQLTSGLENSRGGTLMGLKLARDMNLTSVNGALSATLESLDQQEQEQRQAVNDSGYVQQVAVEQLAHQVAAGLAGSVSSAMDSLETTLKQLREQLTHGDAPPPDELNEMLASAENGLSGGVGTLLDKVEEGAGKAETQLMKAGINASGALQEISSGNDRTASTLEQSFETQMSTFINAARSALGELTERQVQKAQESMAQGTDSMQQLVSGFTDSTEQVYTHVDSAISTSLNELDTNLTGQKSGLEGKIAAEAWRAASKEQPAWKGVVAILLIIVIIVVSIVLSVLTAGAFGPVAAVLIAGVIGAVTAGLIQVINNLAAGEEWNKDLVQAMVIGFAGGLIGGAFGAGASKLAGLAVNRAITNSASYLTRGAINLSINFTGDMLGEAASQAFAYYKYGQDFQWQGFVTAGVMSGISTSRGPGGLAGQSTPRVRGPRPATPRGPRAPLHAPTAGDAAIGLGLAAGMEGVEYLRTGEFDANRLAMTAVGMAGGSWASRRSGALEASSRSRSTSGADTPRSSESGATARSTSDADTSTAGPTRTIEADADLPASVRATSDPEPASPTVRSEADTGPTVRPEQDGGTTTPRSDQDSGTGPRTPAEDAVAPRSRSSHEDSPEIESGVVARRDLGDGHAVTVLKDGRVITCSACGELRMQYAEELADPRNAAHHDEFTRIEAMTDPRAKADAAVRLRNNLEVLRGSGISRLPPGITNGASLARASGLPDVPAGYLWARQGNGLSLRRSGGGIADNNPPIRYDAETRSFTPAFNAPHGYHWARKPNGGYTLKHNPGRSTLQPDLRFDATRNQIVNAEGQPYRSPAPHWRASEIDTGADLNTGILPGELPPASAFRPEVPFKGGIIVPRRTRGSSRPDHFAAVKVTDPLTQRTRTERYSVETKNYQIETPVGRRRLVDTLGTQLRHRARQLPRGTRQIVVVDVRGRSLTQRQQEALATQISVATGGAVKARDVVFYR